ncbi:homoserine kinase [Paenibacillus sp. GCM10012307]|uniref:Homoserine kinase n=1 Tax=Paenibacillus roseus TaxID=2798579 RepID=A0A934J176_9BACL|nr:homoserine kinase [Paenibacillus roseus]MBJ6362941.1 homoserine kinase [Paenibacillus roseus]
MDNRRIIVKIPASTANLGPGFDTLGMALSLYAWIDMSIADEETEIELLGNGMESIPRDKSNLLYKVAQLVFKEAGLPEQELNIAMYSDIPLTRGLGSSASAIVGALVAANALAGFPLTEQQLFTIATRLEGHPDNVGASLFGGIIVAAWDGDRVDHIRLEPPAGIDMLVAIPDFHLATEKARHALPQQYSKQDAVYNISHSSLLVAALASGRIDLIRYAMKDRVHEPYRAALIPGMSQILRDAGEHGAISTALSGAGPTLLALIESDSQRKDELERFLLDTLGNEGVEAKSVWLKPCLTGPELQWLDGPTGEISLMEWIKGEVKA